MSSKENFSLFIFDFPPSKNIPAIFPSRLHIYVFISCSKNLSFFFLFVFTVSKKFFIIFKRLASLCCRRGEKKSGFLCFSIKGGKKSFENVNICVLYLVNFLISLSAWIFTLFFSSRRIITCLRFRKKGLKGRLREWFNSLQGWGLVGFSTLESLFSFKNLFNKRPWIF